VNYLHPVPKPTRVAKARKPLKRKRYMVKRSPRRIARETPAEKYYKTWIHTRWCCGFTAAPGHRCMGPIQQLHIRDMTGASLKESNFKTITGCQALNEEYDQAMGYFVGWSKPDRKAWFRIQILRAHADFLSQHGCCPEDYAQAARERG